MQAAATISTSPRRLGRAHERARPNARLRSSRERGCMMTTYSISTAARGGGA